MIEQRFDVPFIADLALREKQIQQSYRPPIAVHKWFARRPGTLFRGLMLAEFADTPLQDAFYRNNDLHGVRVADPFMGGGTPLMEANRVGCDILGFDINPMAWWIVRQEIEHLDLDAYRVAAERLRACLEKDIGELYRTTCLECGQRDAHVKYFLWVKTLACPSCGEEVRLFPGYLVAEDSRHPCNMFYCAECRNLSETHDRKHPGDCGHCGRPLRVDGPAQRGHCECPSCSEVVTFPDPTGRPPRHTIFAMEYHCPSCRSSHKGRFFKVPDKADMKVWADAQSRWDRSRPQYVPTDEIPKGDETNRLHRWGYRRYREMFNPRQLLGLELSCRCIRDVKDERVRNALSTNLSDLLRYQNMLCRYDSKALKSLDIFSVHGFPVGLIQCESNLLGVPSERGDGNVGSGGWSNVVSKFARAKSYCDRPFEFQHKGSIKIRVDLPQEWIGDHRNGRSDIQSRRVEIICADASRQRLPKASLDAVFTDPPYFGNVQYAELMDFCYVWLRGLVGQSGDNSLFAAASTRNAMELTGNVNMGRGLSHFTEGLSSVFQRMAEGLKAGGPLAFTYHHNDLTAYFPLAVAVLDSGLTCSATLPCPGEMGASIHISGTGSSIIDTVFVCRSTGRVPKRWITDDSRVVADLVRSDIASLVAGNVKPTTGDTRCLVYGHSIRLAIWHLRATWERRRPVEDRIGSVRAWIDGKLGGVASVLEALGNDLKTMPTKQNMLLQEGRARYESRDGEISF